MLILIITGFDRSMESLGVRHREVLPSSSYSVFSLSASVAKCIKKRRGNNMDPEIAASWKITLTWDQRVCGLDEERLFHIHTERLDHIPAEAEDPSTADEGNHLLDPVPEFSEIENDLDHARAEPR